MDTATRINNLYGTLCPTDKREAFGFSLSAARLRGLATLVGRWHEVSPRGDLVVGYNNIERRPGETGRDAAAREFRASSPLFRLLEGVAQPA